jgi:hypothetical protein
LTAAVVALLAVPLPAAAGPTTGAIFGRVVDLDTREPLDGVTVVASGPQGDQAALTDGKGQYELRGLPIGDYQVRFFRGAVAIEQSATVLMDQTVRVNARLPSAPEAVQTIAVTQRAPAIDVGSTRVGVTFTRDFATNVPNSLTLSGLMEKAPGASSDATGLALSGGTGLENAYFLDGLNITALNDGALGANLFVPFLEEVEVVSAGYGAEYGRALGGVVNMATKSGTNEWHGSAFSYLAPGALSGSQPRIVSRATSLTGVTEPDYTTTIGVEVGGPIIKNKLFIWVGYAPEITRNHLVQYADRFVEHVDQDTGLPDGTQALNPDRTPMTVPLYRRSYAGETTTQHYAGKLTWKLAPEQTLSLGLYGIYSQQESMRGANMDYFAGMTNEKTRTNEITARWTAAFFARRWRLDATLGLHTEQYDHHSPFQDSEGLNGITWYNSPSLAQFNPNVASQCATDTGFSSCPVQGYQSGGYGIMRDIDAFRLAGQLKSTNIFHGGGLHELKYGFDGEFIQYEDARWSSGPDGNRGSVEMYPGGEGDLYSLFRLPPGETMANFGDPNDPRIPHPAADLLGSPYYQDVIRARTRAFNSALFVQESYSPRPDLTLNAGVRWEMQQIYDYRGNKALSINDNIAPRLGVVFDPTNEGRSKVFAHYGRFYESIPMTLANRGFGGEGVAVSVRSCAAGETDWTKCALDPTQVFPLTGEMLKVQNGLKGAYNDEVVAGGQYQIVPDLVVGVSFVYRWLGRAIEDMSAPTGQGPSLLANPGTGSVSQERLQQLEQNVARNPTPQNQKALDDAVVQAYIADQPKPTRTYKAVQFQVAKRFVRRLFVTGSYTYSSLRGNYTGLYAADTDQRDPNLSTQYDVRGIMVNRYGPLPNDRPHLIRLDGYYVFTLGRSNLTTGLSFVGRSGQPLNALGRNSGTGQLDTFVVPRGSAGRTPFFTQFDLHLGYRRSLGPKMSAEAFIDIFNVFDQRAVLAQDQAYTVDRVQPLPQGQSINTLAQRNPDGSVATDDKGAPVLANKNPNYLMPTAYQAPIAGRLGVRVSF